jgi:hypothetical protein
LFSRGLRLQFGVEISIPFQQHSNTLSESNDDKPRENRSKRVAQGSAIRQGGKHVFQVAYRVSTLKPKPSAITQPGAVVFADLVEAESGKNDERPILRQAVDYVGRKGSGAPVFQNRSALWFAPPDYDGRKIQGAFRSPPTIPK